MSFIQVRNVWQQYGDQTVLENLRLDIDQGEFCALVGASGCGKSTFLRMLLGQERPHRGQILLDDKPLVAEPDPSRGIVFQRYSVLPHLSVLDNVALGLELPRAPLLGRLFGRAKAEARTQAAQLLRRVGLDHALDKYPSQLSGGMQQRLAIAQALIMKPRMLLLDEPFGALDEMTREHLNEELLAIRGAGAWTAFFVTHSVAEAVFLAGRILVLAANPGRVHTEIAVPLPYPRTSDTRVSRSYLDLVADVSRVLRSVEDATAR